MLRIKPGQLNHMNKNPRWQTERSASEHKRLYLKKVKVCWSKSKRFISSLCWMKEKHKITFVIKLKFDALISFPCLQSATAKHSGTHVQRLPARFIQKHACTCVYVLDNRLLGKFLLWPTHERMLKLWSTEKFCSLLSQILCIIFCIIFVKNIYCITVANII